MRSADTLELKLLRRILERDRAWSAYALADLYPPWNAAANWISGKRSAFLIYRGLEPQLLFAHGDPAELDTLMSGLPPGEYWYTLRPTDYARLSTRLTAHDRARMWRMWLPNGGRGAAPQSTARQRIARGPGEFSNAGIETEPGELDGGGKHNVAQLDTQDLPELKRLYAGMPDGPDAFTPTQLQHGVYFGVWKDGDLVSAAGTHVACSEIGVAAVGNVATLPERRGLGLGYLTSLAVVTELRRQRYQTIVLNVRMDNRPAIRLYRKLGFMPYCGFYEGRGSIN